MVSARYNFYDYESLESNEKFSYASFILHHINTLCDHHSDVLMRSDIKEACEVPLLSKVRALLFQSTF